MNINPHEVIKNKIIIPSKNTKIQQVGIDLTSKDFNIIRKQDFKNIELAEQFDMQGYYGILIVRSSFSRQGLFISSGLYDCGFKGVGGISIYNMSDTDISINEGQRICQIVIYKGDYASLYDGFYNHNETIKSQYEVKNGK